MKSIVFITASAGLILAAYACKTATKAPHNSTFNYDDLYDPVWVVDTILVIGADAVNMETDNNEYQFTKKEGANFREGTRTTITSMARINLSYTIMDGTLHFDPAAMFPVTKFDKNGNVISFRDVSLPPYKIIELTPSKLTLKSDDVLMKLKAK